MKKGYKKLIALLLAAVMTACSVPADALASTVQTETDLQQNAAEETETAGLSEEKAVFEKVEVDSAESVDSENEENYVYFGSDSEGAEAVLGTDGFSLLNPTGRCTIFVLRNKKRICGAEDDYVPAEGATVTWGDNTATANEKGIVEISNYKELNENDLVVSMDGYITKTFTKGTASGMYTVAKLDWAELQGPTINGVYINNTGKNYLEEPFKLTALRSEKDQDYHIDATFLNSTFSECMLYQEGISRTFKSLDFSCNATKIFDCSQPVYLYVTDSKGNTVNKAIQFAAPSGIEGLEDGGIDLGNDTFGFTFPSNVPFMNGLVGGATLGSDDVNNPIPISVCVENGKWYAAIGFKVVSRDLADKEDTTKGLVGNLKKALKQEDMKDKIDQIKNIRGMYKDLQNGVLKGKCVVDCNITITGFAEGYIDEDGEPQVLDFGGIFDGSVDYQQSFPGAIGPVPVFAEVEITAEIKAQIKLAIEQQQAGKSVMFGDAEIGGELGISAGIGVGFAYVASVSGGITGKVGVIWKIRHELQNYFKADLNLSAYVKACVLFFTYKKSWDLASFTMYEYPKETSASSIAMEALDMAGMYDESAYGLNDLSYITTAEDGSICENVTTALDGEEAEEQSIVTDLDGEEAEELLGEEEPGHIAEDVSVSENSGNTTLKSNIYKDTSVKLSTLDNGTKVAVWLDAKDSDLNHIQVFFSENAGSGWTTPTILDADETADAQPALYTDGNTTWVAWVDMAENFEISDELQMSDVAGKADITVARIDEDGSITLKSISDAGLDSLPAITSGKGTVYVAWANNSADKYYDTGKHTSIKYVQYSNGKWTSSKVKYKKLPMVGDLALDYYGGKLSFAYSLNTVNGNESSSRVYKNGKMVSQKKVSADAPAFYNHKLYWYQDGTIIGENAKKASGNITSDQFVLLDSGFSEPCALYTVNDGLDSDIMISYMDPTTKEWSEGNKIVSTDSFIESFDGAVMEDGSIEVLVNDLAITGDMPQPEDEEGTPDSDPYGEADLKLIRNAEKTDLAVDDVYYDNDDFYKGNEMQIAADILNQGTREEQNLTVSLLDADGTVLNQKAVTDVIYPGENYVVDLPFTVTDVDTQKNVTVRVTAEGTDVDVEDNRSLEDISNEDLEVIDVSYIKGDSESGYVAVTVSNNGYSDRENVSVTLREDTASGNSIGATQTIDSIAARSMEVLFFDSDSVENADVLYATIDGEAEDEDPGNNSEYVLVQETAETGETVKTVFGDQVTFISGTKPGNFVTMNKKKTVATLRTLKKTGYVFEGWYNGEEKVTTLTQAYVDANPNLVLKAKWTENSYDVDFQEKKPKKNVSVSAMPVSFTGVKYSEVIRIPDAPTAEGYTFRGWRRKSGGSKLYQPGAEVSGLAGSTVKKNHVIFYPVWKKK